ncbi:hypothetical protein [Paenibacillus foliorum]|uniref:hypothetical protein n=1 Tax=Paenibacillus foliorum TaxID=2654974 RepID=UPI001491929D|nr:hypothetical protein [Paenibacillus foliorum]
MASRMGHCFDERAARLVEDLCYFPEQPEHYAAANCGFTTPRLVSILQIHKNKKELCH